MTNRKMPKYVVRLKRALRDKFDADVDVQKTDRWSRYHFAVVSEKFNRVSPMKRQDRIWDVVDEVLTRDEWLKIGLIYAYAPKELAPIRGRR